MTSSFQIEVCVERPSDALVAQAAGATRIELNSALRLDGLTPTLGACRWLKAHCRLPIIAMLRPHNDGFFLDADDQRIALADCELLLSTGVDGIAYGALDASGNLRLEYFRQIAEQCSHCELVCHRVFDRLQDQRRGLEQLIECGVRRVLTSGGATTAEQGIDRLHELVQWSQGRIEILPAAGINSTNAKRIIELSGCTQLHGTFRGAVDGTRLDSARVDPLEIEKIRATCT